MKNLSNRCHLSGWAGWVGGIGSVSVLAERKYLTPKWEYAYWFIGPGTCDLTINHLNVTVRINGVCIGASKPDWPPRPSAFFVRRQSLSAQSALECTRTTAVLVTHVRYISERNTRRNDDNKHLRLSYDSPASIAHCVVYTIVTKLYREQKFICPNVLSNIGWLRLDIGMSKTRFRNVVNCIFTVFECQATFRWKTIIKSNRWKLKIIIKPSYCPRCCLLFNNQQTVQCSPLNVNLNYNL